MNRGFRILIHKDVEKTDWVMKFLEDQKKLFRSERSYKRGYGPSFYNRGVFGLGFGEKGSCSGPILYTFRRVVRNRRIFGVVPVKILERKDGEPVELDQCMCPQHRGGQKVCLKGGFNEDDYEVWFETGEIKG